ncbi:hypothetical protein [Streptomyces acidiscabies]|uniref:Uncharacterized protein n=1 Tax=Streptomyces acidiscabies TaxID=42234 RepID=A0ABU4M7J9_9ACTN|nr:hypothetical protein [Streptomyces acidiscabies]MDX3024049.1 hypothetical protein [Streptomyces acidiscabies]
MPYPAPAITPDPTGPGHCPDCNAQVLWCLTTANRRRIPINPAPDPTGNQAVRIATDGTHWTRQLTRERPHVEVREVLRRPHLADCPAARRRAATSRRTTGRARSGVRPVRWQR